MTERVLGRRGQRRKRLWLIGPLTVIAMLVGLFVTSAAVAVSDLNCLTEDTLVGSTFEIDAIVPPAPGSKKNTLPSEGANLVVDDATNCLDWAGVSEIRKNDSPTGSGDESFGQGTAENDPVPTIVSGSIPPNKSDLKSFGVYQETGVNDTTFVAVFWSRINSPQGTTNMDFEFNQNTCDGTIANPTPNVGGCSSNGVTPARTTGDKLLLYDLSSGGSVVDIHIRTWTGSVWGAETDLSESSALGSINYESLDGTPAPGATDGLGDLDPLTFGEAVIDFDALLGGAGCGQFGSVYLKSRSSDSFTSEIKDFVPPQQARLSNCPATISTAQKLVPNDSATLGGGGTFDNTGSATFQLFLPDNPDCLASGSAAVALDGSTTLTVVGASPQTVTTTNTKNTDELAGSHTAALGTWHWKVVYSGDNSHAAVTSDCIEAFTIDDDG